MKVFNMEGWIKIHRASLEHWLYNEYRPLTRREAWENIILWANFDETDVLIKGQLITCKRGQLLYSLETYAQKFVWSVAQVRSFFELLKKDGMIKVEGLRYTTRLTVCNYDKYQDKQQTENRLDADCPQPDNKLNADSSQQDKNDKKEKNDKNKYDFILPEFSEAFLTWMDYKKERKESYKGKKGAEAFYNKLIKLSKNNPKIAAEIIEQSMANNWAGIFELKENKNETHQQSNRHEFNGKFTTLAEAMETKTF